MNNINTLSKQSSQISRAVGVDGSSETGRPLQTSATPIMSPNGNQTFSIGVPESQINRAEDHLRSGLTDGPKPYSNLRTRGQSAISIQFTTEPATEGFANIFFHDMDKETFYRVVQRLKLQGIDTIGADTELSEDTIELDKKSMEKLHKKGKMKKGNHTIKFIKEFIQKEVKGLKESANGDHSRFKLLQQVKDADTELSMDDEAYEDWKEEIGYEFNGDFADFGDEDLEHLLDIAQQIRDNYNINYIPESVNEAIESKWMRLWNDSQDKAPVLWTKHKKWLFANANKYGLDPKRIEKLTKDFDGWAWKRHLGSYEDWMEDKLNESINEEIVMYNGEEHEVMRHDGDRVYIRRKAPAAILGKLDAFWVKPEDLSESFNEAKAKIGSKIKVYRDVEDRKPLTMTLGRKIPNNDDDAYEATYEISDSVGFQKKSRKVKLDVAYGMLLRAEKPMWFLLDPWKLDNLSKRTPYKESINESKANYHTYSTEDLRKMYREIDSSGSAQQKKVWKQGIKRELEKRGESINESKIIKSIKNIIKGEAKKLIKEGAIRQWSLGEGGTDGMYVKVPQDTKRDFESYLNGRSIDLDHIADDEMDGFSHYLIYSEISPEILQTFNAEIVNPDEDASF